MVELSEAIIGANQAALMFYFQIDREFVMEKPKPQAKNETLCAKFLFCKRLSKVKVTKNPRVSKNGRKFACSE